MRNITTIAVGLVAGIAGALVVSARTPAAAPTSMAPARIVAAPAPPAAPIVPPGWDRRYLNQLGDRVAALEGQAPAPPTDRERDKLAHYEQELATRETRLADHDRETVDVAWSSGVAARIWSVTGELGVDAHAVDCRSKTCIASLRFASPEAALEFLRSSQMSKLATGFSNMTSTPTPPTSDGDYDLAVVLDR